MCENDKPYAVESFLQDAEAAASCNSDTEASYYEDDIASAEELMLDCIPEEERDQLFAAIDAYTTKFVQRAAPGLLTEFAVRQKGWKEQQELVKTQVLQAINYALSEGVNILKQATPDFHRDMAERMMKAAEEKKEEEEEEEAKKEHEEDSDASELASSIAANLAIAAEEAQSQIPPFFYERDRTVWNDFDKFCFVVNRPREHVQAFFSSEKGLGVESKIDERRRLVLKGTVPEEEIEETRNVYKVVYVDCPLRPCSSIATRLESGEEMDLKVCTKCGVTMSVPKL